MKRLLIVLLVASCVSFTAAQTRLRLRSLPSSSGPAALCEDTFNSPSASRTDVNATIAMTDAGDCVVVPADASESWSGDITISGISLIGPGKGAGSPTNITAGVVNIDKHATAVTRLIGFRFTASGEHIDVDGDQSDAMYVVHDNYFYTNGSHIGQAVNGGVWSENVFHNDSEAGGNNFHVTLGDTPAANAVWAGGHTMGTADTDGDQNTYFENNLVENWRDGFFDCDNGCNAVFRYNTVVDSSVITHGGGAGNGGNDTSTYGDHHLEVYNNTFDRVSNTMALNEWVKFRGASGVFANNTFDNADSPDGFSYTGKPEVNLLVGCPSGGSHPRPYQIGQTTQTPDATPDNPLLIFDNTINNGSFVIGVGEGTPGCSSLSTYVQSGRDYMTSNSWGWVPYTYPHPLHPE